jgi:hypothetical protein
MEQFLVFLFPCSFLQCFIHQKRTKQSTI